MLETRLDNVVYRMGFASTRRDARQLILHGHIMVNNRKIDRASSVVKIGDTVAVIDKSKKLDRVLFGIQAFKLREEPLWLDIEHTQLSGVFKELPTMEQLPAEFKVNLVVELYSK